MVHNVLIDARNNIMVCYIHRKIMVNHIFMIYDFHAVKLTIISSVLTKCTHNVPIGACLVTQRPQDHTIALNGWYKKSIIVCYMQRSMHGDPYCSIFIQFIHYTNWNMITKTKHSVLPGLLFWSIMSLRCSCAQCPFE